MRTLFRRSSPFIRWLHLAGGEIFIREDVPSVLQSAGAELRRLFLLQFATNATLPDRVLEGCRVLAAGPIPRVIATVSIDGLGVEHDRQRGVPGLFDRALGLYREIKARHPGRIGVYLGLTVTRSNCRDLPEIVRRLPGDYGVPLRDLHVNFYHQSDVFYENPANEAISPAEARAAVDLISASLPRGYRLSPTGYFEERYRRLYPAFLENGRPPVLCESFAGSMTIDTAGECRPCTLDRRSAGNVRDFDFRIDRVWESEPRRRIREEIAAGKCVQCWTPCEAFQAMMTHCLPGHRP